MSNLFDQASLICTPNGYKAGKLYSIKPSDGAGDLDVVRATNATRVNSSGLIEVVGNNIPRLDYTNASCPSILVEPQRTNLLLRSNELNTSPWLILLSEVSIDQNFATSPEGIQNANRINFLSGNTRFSQIITVTQNTTYTISFYIKNIDTNQISINIGGTNLLTTNYFSQISVDEWRRVSFTFTTNTGITSISPQITRGGTIGASVLIYGVQLEVGSNATSYIPTQASTVTRNADVISKTGVSSLIGQTEGTVFIDVDIRNLLGSTAICAISDNQPNNRIDLYKTIDGRIGFDRVSPTQSGGNSFATGVLSSGRYKMALAYKSGDTCFFINGIQVSPTYTNTFTFNQLNIFRIGLNWIGSLSGAFNDRINSCTLFQTRLSNTELAQLTTL